MKKLRVTVEGRTYEVLVETVEHAPASSAPAPVAANPPVAQAPAPAAPPAPPAPAPAGGPGDIPSPLSGKVVSIDVKPGDQVDEGAQVATVEAMKMNTYIYAPRAGKVSAVHARPGEGIEEGAPLLTLS